MFKLNNKLTSDIETFGFYKLIDKNILYYLINNFEILELTDLERIDLGIFSEPIMIIINEYKQKKFFFFE